jgi:altronate dehydratase small subunit
MTRKIAVQIHPDDNVVTLVEDALPGDAVQYMAPQGPQEITVVDAVPMGHKVAVDDIAPGQRVLKYREPIGTSSRMIRKGQHVHAHNVESAVQGAKDED